MDARHRGNGTTAEPYDPAPPHDLGAETAALGSVLHDPRVFGDVADIIQDGDFYDVRNAKIFRAMTALHRNSAIDSKLLVAHLVESGDWGGKSCDDERQVDEVYLCEVAGSVPYAANAVHYARIVQAMAAKRRLLDTYRRGIQGVHDGTSVHDLVAWTAGEVDEIARHDQTPDIGRPVPLQQIVDDHPRLRAPVVGGLLRRGEVMNLIAPPKQGKSWLVYGLGMAVADGFAWLDTFDCRQGRVLLIDAELHPETLAYRIPFAAEAAGASADYADRFDVLALRGQGVDLAQLGRVISQIPPDTYSLVILDAWYRFLPPGISENDNAAVMSLYNLIDGYSAHLDAAWVNVHHASKGDQSQKGVTDVGSGAGAQSRAADAHLILRPHDDDDVAVLDVVVRSFPAVDRMAIRFDFPAWFLDRTADPNALRAAQRGGQTSEQQVEADRQKIIEAMAAIGEPAAKTFIRDASGVNTKRFPAAWASLLVDGRVVDSGRTPKRDNGQSYPAYLLGE